MQGFWSAANILALVTIVIFSILTYDKVKHLHGHSHNGHSTQQGVSGSLTSSNGVQLHEFLNYHITIPIAIVVAEGVGTVKYHLISLTTRQAINKSLVEFTMASNSLCDDTVATIDLTKMELRICGKVVSSNALSAPSSHYSHSNTKWEEIVTSDNHGACNPKAVGYETCIYNRQYPLT